MTTINDTTPGGTVRVDTTAFVKENEVGFDLHATYLSGAESKTVYSNLSLEGAIRLRDALTANITRLTARG